MDRETFENYVKSNTWKIPPYQQYVNERQKKQPRVEDIPFYEKNKRPTIAQWHQLDYLDYYQRIQGNDWGESGIGKLTDVAIVKISEWENTNLAWYKENAPSLFEFFDIKMYDVEKWRDEQVALAETFKHEGINVHWIEWPEPPPLGPFGPMLGMWGSKILIVKGGSILQKQGLFPYNFGGSEFLARWLFMNLGITPLVTITGKGAAETGAFVFIDEGLLCVMISAACNEDAVGQITPVLERVGVERVISVSIPVSGYVDRSTGVSAHLSMNLKPVDDHKVLLYRPAVDFVFQRWLQQEGFEVVEVPMEEQKKYFPAEGILLSPGKFMTNAGAHETVRRLVQAGIDVIEVPASQVNSRGAGVNCNVVKLRRNAK